MKICILLVIASLFLSCSSTLNRTSKQDIADFNSCYSERSLTLIRIDGSVTKTHNWILDETYLRFDNDNSQRDSILLSNLHQMRVRNVPKGLLAGLACGAAGVLATMLVIDANESNDSFSSLDNLDQKIGITFGVGAVSGLLGYFLFSEETIVLNETSPQ